VDEAGDNRADGEELVPSGFFVLRTPLLPFDTLRVWSADLEAPRALGDAARLEAALATDRARLRERLRDILGLPEFNEALFVAAPSLWKQLSDWRDDPDSKRGRKVEHPLVGYVVRAAARPTPFGLFAGCAVGVLGSKTVLDVPPRDRYRRHTRLDMGYLLKLTNRLESDPEIRRGLPYNPNSSLYRAAGRLRYAEAELKDGTRSYQLVALDEDDYLRATLAAARSGAQPGTLAEGLVSADGEVTLAEAEAYIGNDVIGSQILVSELAPAVTGPEPMHALLSTLRELPVAADVVDALERVHAAVESLDDGGLGADPERYRAVVRAVEKLPADVEPNRLFQVDMTKPTADAALSDAVVRELVRGVHTLHRLSPSRKRLDKMADFRSAFTDRYGDREVPLVEALDEEIGIGFERSTAPTAEASPLLAGLSLPDTSDDAMRWTARDILLLHKLEEVLATGATEIELTPSDLDRLGQTDRLPLPDAFAVTAMLASPSPAALAEGDFRLLLRNVSGPSGGVLLGRFCHCDETLRRLVEQHVRAEEVLQPDAVFAEIVHLPEGRLGNILCRPVLRDYEIPFLGRSGASRERQLPVTDLLVTVIGDRVVLRSARLDREVVPRLTTAHNFTARSMGTYRFLCTLQLQGVATGLSWAWGPLESARYLPRVSCGRLVLARARWLADYKEIEALQQAARGAAQFQAVQKWRTRRKLPRLVALAEADNELEVDFDNVLSIEAFLHSASTSIRRWRTAARLVEIFPAPDELCAAGPEGRFTHELIVPFTRARQPVSRRLPPRVQVSSWQQRTLVPGSEWLDLRIYTGSSTADRVLRDVVGPFVRNHMQAGLIDRWFFIRYSDPEWHLRLRLHGEPATLQASVLPALNEAIGALIGAGCAWRMRVDTYEREVERYGGLDGVVLAERLFHADSEAVQAIVELLDGEEGADARWRLAVRGMDMLLTDVGLDLPRKLDLAKRAYRALSREFGVDTPRFRTELRKRFDPLRPELTGLLDPAGDESSPLAPALRVLRRRSVALEPVAAALQALAEDRRLTRSLEDMASSYVHMHVNRMLRSAQRAQEMVLYDYLVRLYEIFGHTRQPGPRPGRRVDLPIG
jgi:thiopeptide-type bacteriocin biosynthesis protein